MLEDLCREALFDRCMDVIHKENPVCRIKGKPPPKQRFEHFMSWESKFRAWDGALVKRSVRNSPGDPLPNAMRYFSEHRGKICDAFIQETHGGDLPRAMEESGTFENLFDSFLDYFSKKRGDFMESTNALLEAKRGELISQNKVPQSHGGVANLLKVLTQTMKAQGSSIRTIAKVQYAVCLQAGIYIPEEFITDVLVAANIEETQGGKGNA